MYLHAVHPIGRLVPTQDPLAVNYNDDKLKLNSNNTNANDNAGIGASSVSPLRVPGLGGVGIFYPPSYHSSDGEKLFFEGGVLLLVDAFRLQCKADKHLHHVRICAEVG